MKGYLPFIATVIFSLSQPQVYGMGNENFDFNSFDLFDDLVRSPDLSEQETRKNMDDLEVEKQNIKTLFSDFLKNEQNSTVSQQIFKKAPEFQKKRSREDEEKFLKNQSEQKKIRFNKNGTQAQQADLLNISLLPQNQKIAISQVPSVMQPQNSKIPSATIMTITKNTENNLSLVAKTQAPQKSVCTNFRLVNGEMVKEKAEDFSISHWNENNLSHIPTLNLRQKAIVALFEKAGNSAEQLAEVKKVLEQNLKSVSKLLGWFFIENENQPSPMIRLLSQNNQYSFIHLMNILNIFNVNIYRNKGSNGAAGKVHYKKFADFLGGCISNSINPECSSLIKKVVQVEHDAPRIHPTLYIFGELKKLLNPSN